jgi:hypothetical protein
MMPAFSAAISSTVSPSSRVWSIEIGEDGEGHPGEHLEEGHRGRVALVHQPDVRDDLVVGLDEPCGRDRRAVHDDPLPDRDQVRAGEAAGPQPAAAQQRVGHPGGRGLAVGARDVDDGTRPLRIAEQPDEFGHPVQGEVHGMLGPARDDFPLDLAHPRFDIHRPRLCGRGVTANRAGTC